MTVRLRNSRRRALRRTGVAVGILCLMALAFFLRVYQLDAQSLWFDDYNSFVHLDKADFAKYVAAVREDNAEHTPVYFVLEYLWARVAGATPWRVRLLSVLLGVSGIPLLYALGRFTVGRGGALLGCAFYALSPALVFHHQAVRPYALLVLLALAALYTLVRAVRGDGRVWWILNSAAHVGLVGTHPFGALLLLAEGVYVLCFVRGRVFAGWAAAQVLLLAPWGLWIATAPRMPFDAYLLYRAPGISTLLASLVGGDIVRANVELRPAAGAWWFLDGQEDLFFGMQPVFNVLLWLSGVSAAAWGVFALVGQRVRGGAGRPGAVVLLTLTLLLPVLALAVLSYVWRPCLFPRYTLYTLPVLHLLLGGLLWRIRWRAVRAGFALLVLLAYACQVSLVAPVDARTGWRGVAAHLVDKARAEDIALVCKTPGLAVPDLEILRWHLNGEGPDAYPAHTLAAVLAKATCRLKQEPGATVWAVIQRSYQPLRLPALEAGLERRGMSGKRFAYPAGEGLLLYRLSAGEAFQPGAAVEPPRPEGVDYGRMFRDLPVGHEDAVLRREAEQGLPRLFDQQMPPPDTPQKLGEWGLMLLDECAPHLAEALAAAALTRDARNPAALAAFAFASLELGRYRAAEDTLAILRRLVPVPGQGAGPGLQLPPLAQAKDPAVLRPVLAHLMARGMTFPTSTLVLVGLNDVDFCCQAGSVPIAGNGL